VSSFSSSAKADEEERVDVLTPLGPIALKVEGRAKSGNKTTDVETAANELVTCAKEMNGKMDVVEESEAQVEKKMELVAEMEQARTPLKQVTEKAMRLFSKRLPDFFDQVCVKYIYQPSFARSAFNYGSNLARLSPELKGLFALVETRNIQVRFDSMMWRSHVLQLYVKLESVNKMLVEQKKDIVELKKDNIELKKDNNELKNDNVELKEVLGMTKNSNVIMELKTQMATKDGEITSLQTQVQSMLKKIEIMEQDDADIFFREVAINIEKWISDVMGDVDLDIRDLLDEKDKADPSQWKFIYRMHRAYEKARMSERNTKTYEKCLRQLFPDSRDLLQTSGALYDHIRRVKDDGNVIAHPRLPQRQLERGMDRYSQYIDDPDYWTQLVGEYKKTL
jgi:hypothetical protein